MTSLDPVVIREALAGYEAANDVSEAERRGQLADMTSAASLAIWRDLESNFNARPQTHVALDRLDLWQLQGRLVIRRLTRQFDDYLPNYVTASGEYPVGIMPLCIKGW